MYILGISAFYHDSAAALIQDGNIVAAAQEERFTRKKHDAGFPVYAIQYCLGEAGIAVEDIDTIVYYTQPYVKLERIIKNILALGYENDSLINTSFQRIASYEMWIHKIVEKMLGGYGKKGKILTTKHHIAHAASAFYPSPFNEAVILTIDGVGEWSTTTIGVGKDNKIQLYNELKYPHSLGLFYSAFTYFCGFKVNSGDYKFMGLAPYGTPVYYNLIKQHIIDIKDDGSFRLHLEYFDFYKGKTMIHEEKFSELFGGGRRQEETRISQREMDIAASVQKITEEIIIRIAKHAKLAYGKNIDNLVMAGGVALNCVANGKLQKEGIFKNIWIQPAAGDAGGALGAALYTYYDYYNHERIVNFQDSQKGSLLGPEFKEDIKSYLDAQGYPYHLCSDEDELVKKVAELLEKENIIGFFHGRMEFGPRALGNRSILADCRSPCMQQRINLKIKFRESFRPFAPIVLREKQKEYFDLPCDSPYMLKVGNVLKSRQKEFDIASLLKESNGDMLRIVSIPRSDIPAVTHVDYSARIQTVGRENKLLYEIMKEYERLTGYAVLVNTSFNVRGEPIVCTPEDAYICFMRTNIDVLVLENFILFKEEQPDFLETGDWRRTYGLD